MEIKIHCHGELVDISTIKVHPKNKNTHPEKQIKILCKVFKKVGIRRPLIVSENSGYLVAGHGVFAALQELNVNPIPVVFQKFVSEEEEYNFMIADNETARHSVFLLNDFLIDMENFGIDLESLDRENYGLENIQGPDFPGQESESEEEEDKIPDRAKTKTFNCPNCGETIEV